MSGIARERRRSNSTVNIVPLLDVLTTILLYCLVMMQFKQHTAALNITLPDITTAGKNMLDKSINISVTKDGKYFYNGKEVTAGELTDILTTVGKATEKPPMVIRADEQTPLKNVTFLMDTCRDTGFDDFRLQSRTAQ
jgi:biopolymer transport protein ExbD